VAVQELRQSLAFDLSDLQMTEPRLLQGRTVTWRPPGSPRLPIETPGAPPTRLPDPGTASFTREGFERSFRLTTDNGFRDRFEPETLQGFYAGAPVYAPAARVIERRCPTQLVLRLALRASAHDASHRDDSEEALVSSEGERRPM
jgi:hypothetical protein